MSEETRPPWIVFPHIPVGHIGWRMGAGEDYNVRFRRWFGTLTPAEQAHYAELNPEPPGWSGTYKEIAEFFRDYPDSFEKISKWLGEA
jgi:hypothetical protein